MGHRKKKTLWIASWLLATALLIVLGMRADWGLILRSINEADWGWLGAGVAANLAILPVGALQWWSLLPRGASIGRIRMTRLFALTSLANNTAPSVVGHAAGAMLIAAEPGVGSVAALSVIALDQVCVGIAKITVLATAAATSPMPEWMRTGLAAVSALVAVLVATVMIIARSHERIARWVARSDLGGAGAVVGGIFARWSGALDVMRSPRRLLVAVGYGLLVKAAEGAGIACVQAAFGISPSIASVSLVLAATSLSSVIPLAPANLGTYEAATWGAYRALGLTADEALGIAVVQHACLLVAAVLPGYLLMLRQASATEAEAKTQRSGMDDSHPELVVPGVDRPESRSPR